MKHAELGVVQPWPSMGGDRSCDLRVQSFSVPQQLAQVCHELPLGGYSASLLLGGGSRSIAGSQRANEGAEPDAQDARPQLGQVLIGIGLLFLHVEAQSVPEVVQVKDFDFNAVPVGEAHIRWFVDEPGRAVVAESVEIVDEWPSGRGAALSGRREGRLSDRRFTQAQRQDQQQQNAMHTHEASKRSRRSARCCL